MSLFFPFSIAMAGAHRVNRLNFLKQINFTPTLHKLQVHQMTHTEGQIRIIWESYSDALLWVFDLNTPPPPLSGVHLCAFNYDHPTDFVRTR
jgi:hypothetical protein